ncbi:hypothetical protein GGQ68_000072 [Sagittula marina]|uniref:Uncharacterized protein n=1 Tax=Sagittula marina TaxID=943940 RepID=A0A7W6GPW1_9RHOB|nr:hypothetical protein [Sagittula marina]MBB3983761.1 hypothetical protein [Sagittula marina]
MGFFAFLRPTLGLLNQRIFAALRLSVLPVLCGLGIWMLGRLYAGGEPSTGLSYLCFVLLELLALCFCHAWFAIRWMRLVLLGEPQTAIGGLFPPRAWRRYGLRLFGLACGFWVVAEGVIATTDHFWTLRPTGEWVRYITLYLGLAFVFHRISPVLAGVPVGAPLTRGEAWRATRGANRACLGLAAGTLLLSSILKFPLAPEGAEISAYEPLFIVAAFWIQVLAFTSAVTVVYRRTVMGE